MKDKEKASMRIGSVEVQEVTGTVREFGNTIDIWLDGVSQLHCMTTIDFSESLDLLSITLILSIKVNVKFIY